MKKLSLIFVQIIFFSFLLNAQTQKPAIALPSSSAFNFGVISDHGRNGYYNQKEVAEAMVKVAGHCSFRFIVTAGDNFQVSGVQSVQDPLWMSSFENIYTHPSLHVEWYPTLGNHDHGGDIQAQVDYSKISRRWKMPAPYYTMVKKRDSVSLRLVMIDTYPIIEGVDDPNEAYTMAGAQKQLNWIDSVLNVAKEDWVIVVGHHPIYSSHPTRQNNKALLQYLYPVLNKHRVDFYVAGHDHIYQHLRDPKSKIDYFVNTAASSVRPKSTNEMTIFSASAPGFSVCSATKAELSIYFINLQGNPIYKYSRKK